MRSVRLATLVWLGLIVTCAMFGVLMSFLLVSSSELLEWNGWSYMLFMTKEVTMFGFVLIWPFVLIALVVWLLSSHDRKIQ